MYETYGSDHWRIIVKPVINFNTKDNFHFQGNEKSRRSRRLPKSLNALTDNLASCGKVRLFENYRIL